MQDAARKERGIAKALAPEEARRSHSVSDNRRALAAEKTWVDQYLRAGKARAEEVLPRRDVSVPRVRAAKQPQLERASAVNHRASTEAVGNHESGPGRALPGGEAVHSERAMGNEALARESLSHDHAAVAQALALEGVRSTELLGEAPVAAVNSRSLEADGREVRRPGRG